MAARTVVASLHPDERYLGPYLSILLFPFIVQYFTFLGEYNKRFERLEM